MADHEKWKRGGEPKFGITDGLWDGIGEEVWAAQLGFVRV